MCPVCCHADAPPKDPQFLNACAGQFNDVGLVLDVETQPFCHLISAGDRIGPGDPPNPQLSTEKTYKRAC